MRHTDLRPPHTPIMDPSPVPLSYAGRIHLFLLLLAAESKRDAEIARPLAQGIFLDESWSIGNCSPWGAFLMERVACELLADALLTRGIILLEIGIMLYEAAARMGDAPPFYAWMCRAGRRRAVARSRRQLHRRRSYGSDILPWSARHRGHPPPCWSRLSGQGELGAARVGAVGQRESGAALPLRGTDHCSAVVCLPSVLMPSNVTQASA